jgi:hypothetical protein
MPDTKRAPAGFGPEVEMPAPWSAFGVYAVAMEPVIRNAARANLELSSLVGQRCCAYMALPHVLSDCRTPMDLMLAQAAFWQQAGRQYAEAGQRVMEAWRHAMPMPVSVDAESASDRRDFMTFPESHGDEAGEDRRHPGGTRRAA